MNNILYTVSTATCFATAASPSDSLILLFPKFTKAIQVTNSIKSVYQNVYICDHYS